MKILMLCDFYDKKLEFQENILTKYYTKFNHEVTVITSTFDDVFDYYAGNHDNNLPKKVYYDHEVKIIKLPYKFNILNKLRVYVNIQEILDDEKPDLIYVHDIMLNILECVKYIKKNPKTKMIMDYHADYSNSGKNWLSLNILHGVIRKWYLDKSMQYISKIFPVVPAGEIFLNEIYNVPYSKMEVLPLGADVDLCNEIQNDKKLLISLKNKYNILGDSKVIVTGGKLTPRKKVELLIEAFRTINNNKYHLIIIGGSSDVDDIYIKMLKDLSKDNSNIHFTGWLNTREIYAHFHISTLAVFPASQSILWQQSIAAGLPLIVGNTGGQSIKYLNKYNNIIILQKDNINVAKLIYSIELVFEDEYKYNTMKVGSQKITKEKLDWNSLIKKTTNIGK